MSNTNYYDVANYTIYVVNQSASTQIFWCFLSRPQELVDNPNVFANSSTLLAVSSYSPAVNTFTIPVQYVVGAGASNKAVGLNIKVDASITENADLTDTWQANYLDAPPPQAPSMALTSEQAPTGTIAIKSNSFNQAQNQANSWFGNMSFGIQTAGGFIGMSWSPSPLQKTTITPNLKFYVAVGSYSSNTLASWDTVSIGSAEIKVPESFQYNKCTVTYTNRGTWIVTRGAPPAQLLAGGKIDSLIQSHWCLSKAHANLVAWCQPCNNAISPTQNDTFIDTVVAVESPTQNDTVVSVNWDDNSVSQDMGFDLSGSINVATALVGAFAYFVLSSVKFKVERVIGGGTTVMFSYNGSDGAQEVKKLLVEGAQVVFHR